MVDKCLCKHKEQDKWYGKGKRVFNKCVGRSGNEKKYRCTVCGREVCK